jgi:hypothetical protein
MNKIEIALSPEDQARLDALAEKLDGLTRMIAALGLKLNDHAAKGEALTQELEKAAEPAPSAEPESEKPADQVNTPPWEETPTEPAEAPKTPTVTLAQIQQKATQLLTSSDAKKKAATRDAIKARAEKVSALPPEVWDELWEELKKIEEA